MELGLEAKQWNEKNGDGSDSSRKVLRRFEGGWKYLKGSKNNFGCICRGCSCKDYAGREMLQMLVYKAKNSTE